MVELLLVWKFYRACPVEELRSSISTHVLKLDSVDLTRVSSSSNAPVIDWLLLLAIRENLVIEESQVVGTSTTCETLVRIRVRAELVYYVLSILGSGQELISLTSSVVTQRRRTLLRRSYRSETRALVVADN